MYTKTSITYAGTLKKQFSLASPSSTSTDDFTRPPHKQQAKIIDYDSDSLTKYPPLVPAKAPTPTSSQHAPQPTQPPPVMVISYATEMTELKSEINQLKTVIHEAMKQIRNTLAAIHAPPTQEINATDLKTENNMETTKSHEMNSPSTQLDLLPIINKLKHDIATIAQEMHAMFQKYVAPNSNSLTLLLTLPEPH